MFGCKELVSQRGDILHGDVWSSDWRHEGEENTQAQCCGTEVCIDFVWNHQNEKKSYVEVSRSVV